MNTHCFLGCDTFYSTDAIVILTVIVSAIVLYTLIDRE